MPLASVSAAAIWCHPLRASPALSVVRCQSLLSASSTGRGHYIGSPAILVEAPLMGKAVVPMPSLKAPIGQVKAGNLGRNLLLFPPPACVTDALETVVSTDIGKRAPSKIDKSGRFCSPRAARELALTVAYASCLEGSDPLCVFDRRLNAKREPGYVLGKALLLQYDHMSFGGEPVQVETEEEAEELLRKNEKVSTIEAEILSAPIKLVYSKFVIRFARDIIGAVVKQWNQHAPIIEKIIPRNWKDEPASRILELCIFHLAMSEITEIGTPYQIVVNEAVDLAKRFCDGYAAGKINRCLRTYIKDHYIMS